MSQPLQGLYAITDPQLTPGDRVLSAAEAALRGGATLLQYRDKPADADTRRHRAARLALLCKDHGARFIVNDDAALAAEVEADGVHLGQSDGAVGRARMLLGDDKLIGVSCHGRLDLAQKPPTRAPTISPWAAFSNRAPSRARRPRPWTPCAKHAAASPCRWWRSAE